MQLHAMRPLCGREGMLAWWFDGERLRIALLHRPVSGPSVQNRGRNAIASAGAGAAK